MPTDDRSAQAGSWLMSRAEVGGAAALRVDDGELVAFKAWKLREILAGMEAAGKDTIIIFIKNGTGTLPESGSLN